MSASNAPSPHPGPLGQTPPDASAARSIPWRSFLLAGGAAGLFGCLVVLGVLAEMVARQEADALDTFATPFFHGLASPPLDALMNAATFLGSDPIVVPMALAVSVGLLWFGRRREGLFVLAVLGGSVVVNLAMKLFFHRPRPVLAWAHVLPDYSFPSGHSMNSLALGLALCLVVWRVLGPRWGAGVLVVAILASLTIGISRIYLGYHYLTDVVGGFAAAILWVAIVVGVFRATSVRYRRGSEGADPRGGARFPAGHRADR
jgi:undecaprenyl-diphosphatase